jgi:superfamily I DNA/RNA helicase
MAKILPERPVGAASAAFLRVHRLVESLPDHYVAWSPVVREGCDLPDFWIVDETTLRGLVLVVSEATEEEAGGPGLFGSEATWTDPVAAAEERVAKAREALGIRSLRGAVVFPDVPGGLLPRRLDGWPRAGRETCRPAAFAPWVESHLGDPVEASVLQAARARFSPESVVPARHAMRRGPDDDAPRFLTWRQEEILKADLDPGLEGSESARDLGLLLVQGVAGSGKSLVMLHRALLLSRLPRSGRVLVLTCNKPLQVELKRRFEEMSEGRGGRVEFLTFHGFCLKRWPSQSRPAVMDGMRRRELHEVALGTLGRQDLTRIQVEDEFAWIFDHGFPDEESYAARPRRGRGFRMDAALRSKFWSASRTFRETCAKEGVADWSLIPLLFLEALECAEDLPLYDAVLVDEAQFFAPVWFECLKRFLAPRAHLFLSADPSQGFLRRGTSWKSVGLSVQGRTRRLERSHRSTLGVMDFAWRAWNARSPEETDAVVPKLDGMREGPSPEWRRFPSSREESAWVVDQIATLIESGGDPADVLVLHDDWGAARDLRERLVERLGAGRAVDARENTADGAVRVCTLNAATGLESPVVFLAGAQRIFEREGSPELDAESRDQARDEATRKFHMAVTRAGSRLVVTSAGPLPDEVAKCFASRRER